MKAPHVLAFLNNEQRKRRRSQQQQEQQPQPQLKDDSSKRLRVNESEKEALTTRQDKKSSSAESTTTMKFIETTSSNDNTTHHHDETTTTTTALTSSPTLLLLASTPAHAAFVSGILEQCATFLSHTSQSLQKDPHILETTLGAFQNCLDALLRVYLQIHTQETPQQLLERANQVFQQNYAQWQGMCQGGGEGGTSSAEHNTATTSASTMQETTTTTTSTIFPARTIPPTVHNNNTISARATTATMSAFSIYPPSTSRRLQQGPAFQAAASTENDTKKTRDMEQDDKRKNDVPALSVAKPTQPRVSEESMAPAPVEEPIAKLSATTKTQRVDTTSTPFSSLKHVVDISVKHQEQTTPTKMDKENELNSNDASAASVGWSCSECTLHNSPSKRRCSACQARRPVIVHQLPQHGKQKYSKQQQQEEDQSQTSIIFSLSATQDTIDSPVVGTKKQTQGARGGIDDVSTMKKDTNQNNEKASEHAPTAEGFHSLVQTKHLSSTLPNHPPSSSDSQETVDPTLSPDDANVQTKSLPLTVTNSKHRSSESEETVDPAVLLGQDDFPPPRAASEIQRAEITSLSNKRRPPPVDKSFVSAPWLSNEPARRFIKEMEEEGAKARQSRKGPVKTVGTAGTEWQETRRPPKPKSNENSDLWSDSEDDNEPQYAYHETVRGHARKLLPSHDCPECAKFFDALMTTESQQNVHRQFCRHRSRFGPPPETPENFWDLEFLDERRAREKAGIAEAKGV
jgi:hypothetical protein